MSLDIIIVSNNLPWEKIEEALEFYREPPYLHGIIRAYVRDRSIIYIGGGGEMINNMPGIGTDVLRR